MKTNFVKQAGNSLSLVFFGMLMLPYLSFAANPILACTVIYRPGDYELVSNLQGTNFLNHKTLGLDVDYPENMCIWIMSSDVKLDCKGHTIKNGYRVINGIEVDGPRPVTGIYVAPPPILGQPATLKNVKISNCEISQYDNGVLIRDTDKLVLNSNKIHHNFATGVNIQKTLGAYAKETLNWNITRDNYYSNTQDLFVLNQLSSIRNGSDAAYLGVHGTSFGPHERFYTLVNVLSESIREPVGYYIKGSLAPNPAAPANSISVLNKYLEVKTVVGQNRLESISIHYGTDNELIGYDESKIFASYYRNGQWSEQPHIKNQIPNYIYLVNIQDPYGIFGVFQST